MELRDRVAIITGSGRGIGRELAREFARQGARVACLARSETELAETVSLIESEGGVAIRTPADVTDREQVETAVDETLRRWERIDVLFNCAGRFNAIGAVWEVDPDDWWRDVTVNVRGPMLCARAVLPHMMERDEGVIINMNGGGSSAPMPGGTGYGSSKAALLRFTDSLARELERVGSSVLTFAIGPGLVRTAMTELQIETEVGRKWFASTAEGFATGRCRQPDECAKSTVELLRIACPELNGRVFNTGADFADIARRAKDIQNRDAFALRMRT